MGANLTMVTVHLEPLLLGALTGLRLVYGVLWGGLALLTVTLIALLLTRWGQSQLLRKCMVLSLWTHLLLAVYAATVDIVTQAPGKPREKELRISAVDGPTADGNRKGTPLGQQKPWEEFATSTPTDAEPTELERPKLERSTQPLGREVADVPPVPSDLPLDDLPAEESSVPEPKALAADASTKPDHVKAAEPIEVPDAEKKAQPKTLAGEHPEPMRPEPSSLPPESLPRPNDSTLPASLVGEPRAVPRLSDVPVTPQPASSLASTIDATIRPAKPAPPHAPPYEPEPGSGNPSPEAVGALAPEAEQSPRAGEAMTSIVGRSAAESSAIEFSAVAADAPTSLKIARHASDGEYQAPAVYQLRMAPDHARLAERRGGSAETEAAVKAALKWLAANQSRDGRWDASELEGGHELRSMGQDRRGAGAQADTGVTALALLAFLGAGHTQSGSEYAPVVTHGIQFLLGSQAADGNLGGDAEVYAFMYCHGMSTLALSEAYAMTGDRNLLGPMQRAVAYTLASQNRTTGGWRYRRGDVGDTSQLGWQLMALKSAELAGIEVPSIVRERMVRFLKSVSSGRYNGLASYRPGEQPSRTMTAEALVCRQFLGMARQNRASDEAGDYTLEELPGTGPANFYYWYYATLGMYQLEGTHWTRWNEALSSTLLASQRTNGKQDGSWDPDKVWGGYGGRVYSTALGALCLEVYYRYLPLYIEAASLDRKLK
jgi:hypothetical protein